MTTTTSDPQPDDRSTDDATRRFNEAFYRSDPADYLLTRLQLLLLAGSRRADLEKMIYEGVEFAGLTIAPTVPSAVNDRDDATIAADAADYQNFLTIESQALLHHAAETLLRTFIVHAAQQRVPWINFRGTNWRDFVAMVQTIIDTPPTPELVGFVCLGSAQCPEKTSGGDWNGAVAGLTAFLRHLASVFLEDANLYNCIKHGLGARAGNTQMIIGPMLFGDGPSVEFPEPTEWYDHGQRDWSLTTRWIDIGQSIALVHVAANMTSSIWRIGRARDLGDESKGQLYFPVDLRPLALRTANRSPGQRMSWHHLTEQRL